MEIRNKKECFRLLHNGSLGNKLESWNSYDEIVEAGYNGTVTMRYKGRRGGVRCDYNVPVHEIRNRIEQWVDNGLDSSLITFNRTAPDDKLLLQGEVCDREGGLVLFYSTEQKPMREALSSSGRHAFGLSAQLILRHFANPSSYSDLETLMEIYPEHVIEFGIYDILLGDVPGRNTIIWEVRLY